MGFARQRGLRGLLVALPLSKAKRERERERKSLRAGGGLPLPNAPEGRKEGREKESHFGSRSRERFEARARESSEGSNPGVAERRERAPSSPCHTTSTTRLLHFACTSPPLLRGTSAGSDQEVIGSRGRERECDTCYLAEIGGPTSRLPLRGLLPVRTGHAG